MRWRTPDWDRDCNRCLPCAVRTTYQPSGFADWVAERGSLAIIRVTSPIYNEEHRQFLSRKIVLAARAVLSGEVGIIAGARELCGLGHEIGADRDAEFRFFVGLESETDHLPVGDVRQHWSADALREKDAEVARVEAFYRERAFEICRQLIKKYDHDG